VSGADVALKIIAIVGVDAGEEARFQREGRVLSGLSHPSIVRVVDFGQLEEGHPYVAMEWLEGEDVAQRLRRAPLSLPQCLEVGAMMADALAYAHAAGVIHRDVKPSNIFLVGSARDTPPDAPFVAKLVDFGVAAAEDAKLTRTGAIVGTPAYMAPEQARGEPVSRLSDTYAAAIIFWELLTGERLFAGKTEAETVHKCLVARARRPSLLVPELGPELDAILEKGLSRDPAQRYATAEEMARDIEACVPAVRPSEVGAWVQRIAGDALADRARVIAALEAPPSSEEPTVTSTPAMAATGPEPARPRSRAAWVAAVLAALGIASTVTVLARSGAPSSTRAAVAAPVIPMAPVLLPPVAAPTPAETAVAAPTASSAVPAAVVASASRTSPSKAPVRPTRSTRPVGRSSSPSACDEGYAARRRRRGRRRGRWARERLSSPRRRHRPRLHRRVHRGADAPPAGAPPRRAGPDDRVRP
jgi:hypothetical protein